MPGKLGSTFQQPDSTYGRRRNHDVRDRLENVFKNIARHRNIKKAGNDEEHLKSDPPDPPKSLTDSELKQLMNRAPKLLP
jgi:hypothetical protein